MEQTSDELKVSPSLTGYYSKKPVNNFQGISTPYVQRFTPRRPVLMEDRHFDGHYIDPSKTFFKFVFKYVKFINVRILNFSKHYYYSDHM